MVSISRGRNHAVFRQRRIGLRQRAGAVGNRDKPDVRGQALTIVAIDKLPFSSPADPLMMARLEFIRRQGGNGFSEHQVPQAVLSLKQGGGRLLRDQSDYGVIVLCDPRISSKNYGKKFLQCFEPMPTTTSIEDVKDFLEAHEKKGAVA
jgi:ATP-dependent DNA helicase DinG